MKYTKKAFGLVLALSLPNITIAQDALTPGQDAYYQPYSISSCLGVFSPAFTPSPELSEILETTVRPRRLEVIARSKMNEAMIEHRVNQCSAMKQGLEPEPCPVGVTLFYDHFLSEVIEEFSGAEIATIEAGVQAQVYDKPSIDILEACEK